MKTTVKKPAASKPKTIHLTDAPLVADILAVAKHRGLAVLSIGQIVRIALGEWIAAQKK